MYSRRLPAQASFIASCHRSERLLAASCCHCLYCPHVLIAAAFPFRFGLATVTAHDRDTDQESSRRSSENARTRYLAAIRLTTASEWDSARLSLNPHKFDSPLSLLCVVSSMNWHDSADNIEAKLNRRIYWISQRWATEML